MTMGERKSDHEAYPGAPHPGTCWPGSLCHRWSPNCGLVTLRRGNGLAKATRERDDQCTRKRTRKAETPLKDALSFASLDAHATASLRP